MRWLRLRFDVDQTAVRPRYDHSTIYIMRNTLVFATQNKLCGKLPQYAPATCKLTFDLLALKVVTSLWRHHCDVTVTWATSVPILVFLSISVLNLGPMYATDRRQTVRRQTASSLNAPA